MLKKLFILLSLIILTACGSSQGGGTGIDIEDGKTLLTAKITNSSLAGESFDISFQNTTYTVDSDSSGNLSFLADISQNDDSEVLILNSDRTYGIQRSVAAASGSETSVGAVTLAETVDMDFTIRDSSDSTLMDGVSFAVYGTSYVYTSSNGKVEISLPVGDYSAKFTKDSYYTLEKDFNTSDSSLNIFMDLKTMPHFYSMVAEELTEKTAHITIKVSSNVTNMILSEDINFLNENWHDFDYYGAKISEADSIKTIEIDYEFDSYGEKTVYAKFSTGAEGAESLKSSATVNLAGGLIEFEDANLRSAIAGGIGKADDEEIYYGDVAEITSLSLVNMEIESLKGLESFEKLTDLDISGNSVDNLSYISDLTSITVLTLSNNKITGFNLPNLTELTELNLSGNSISESLNFNSYKKLETLELNGIGLNSLPTMDQCTDLKALDLSDNSLSGIIDFSDFNLLEELYVYNNSISRLTGVSSSLTALNIYRNPIENYVFVNALKDLTVIYFGNNGNEPYIDNIDFLDDLNSLTTIFIGTDKIDDISLIDDLDSVFTVYLHKDSLNDESQIIVDNRTDISWLSNGFPEDPILSGIREGDERYYYKIAIENRDNSYKYYIIIDDDDTYDIQDNLYLEYSETGEHNLTLIAYNSENDLRNSVSFKFTVANRIYNFDSGIEEEIFKFLEEDEGYIIREDDLLTVKELDLSSKNISSLNDIENLTNIEELNLSENSIEDISDIPSLSELRVLDLSKNLIDTLFDCTALTNLTELNLSKNYYLNNFINLNDLSSLEVLDISDTDFSDLSEILLLENLTDLNISNTNISDIEKIGDFTKIERLFLGSDSEIANLENVKNLPNLTDLYYLSSNITESDYALFDELEENGVNVYFSAARPVEPILDGIEDGDVKTAFSISISNYRSAYTYYMTIDGVDYEIGEDAIEYSETGAHELVIYCENNGLRSSSLEINFEVADDVIDFGSSVFKNLVIGKIKEMNPEFNSEIVRQSDLSGLTELVLSDEDISDISGIGAMTDLTTLNLSKNSISDVSEIAELINLTWLSLSRNNISDISGFENLTNLTWLSLSSNKIFDISFLEEDINIEILWIWGNKISDLSSLRGMNKLRELYVFENSLSTISEESFENLTELEIFEAYENEISDISFLINCNDLRTIDLSDNLIGGIDVLSDMNHLGELNLARNKNIFSIEALSGLYNLRKLNLGDNNLMNIDALSNLRYLDELYLYENYLSDSDSEKVLEPLSNLQNLKKLGLSTNHRDEANLGISDISSLKDLSNLEWLNLSENSLQYVDDLRYLQNLKELYLGSNNILSGDSISELVNLEKLIVYKNNIYQDYNWERLINLKELDVEGNQGMTDISFMLNYINLEKLDIRGLVFSNEELKDAQTVVDYLEENGCEVLMD